MRHGESEWNRAQGALDLGAMFSQAGPSHHYAFIRTRTLALALALALP